MRSQAGFTLAELVVVLVLMGILGAIAVPRMTNWDSFAARGGRDAVAAALRHAQKSAIAMRRNVCVSVGTTRLAITYASAAGADQACASGNALMHPANGLRYDDDGNAFDRSTVATPTTLIFDALGRPLSAVSTPRTTALSITVTGYATAITVEPETGTVR